MFVLPANKGLYLTFKESNSVEFDRNACAQGGRANWQKLVSAREGSAAQTDCWGAKLQAGYFMI